MVKVIWLAIGLAAMLGSCRSVEVKPREDGQSLQGNWSFVYYEAVDTEEESMPGPPFESLRFVAPHKVEVRMLLGMSQPLLCPYTYRQDTFRVSLPVTRKRSVAVKCQAYLAGDGNLLVLRDRGTGAVFIRTETLESDSAKLAGNWLVTGEKVKIKPEHVTMSHAGGILFRESGIRGDVRLWRSEAGLMMSAFLYQEGRGLRTVVWRVEARGEHELRMTPYGPRGTSLRQRMIWRRMVRPIGALQ